MNPLVWFVVAPHELDESFWRALERDLKWKIRIDHSVAQATAFLECADFLVLDTDLPGPLVQIAEKMRKTCPQMHLIWLASTSSIPIGAGWQPWSFLRKPVSSEDLKNHLDRLMKEPPSTETNIPVWLQNPDQVAAHLTKLTLETSAQATLIAYKGALWAYAGELSQPASAEVVDLITQSVTWQPDVDLLRFVYLKNTRQQHMLYGMRLADDMILAMLFDVEASFSEVRAQAEKLAQRVLRNRQDAQPPSPRDAGKDLISAAAEESLPAVVVDDTMLPDISEILQEVPSPTPTLVREKALSADALLSAMGREHPSIETNPPIRRPAKELDVLGETHRTDLGLTRPSSAARESELEQTIPSTRDLDETQVSGQDAADALKSVTQAASHVILEPASPALYNLHYACLLTPRRAEHRLIGDLKNDIEGWMRDIALAYGWRLDKLNIQPDYLQWVVSVPPSTSPAAIMRLVRRDLSERILKAYPRIKERLADDFWAPGYLVMGGERPHPPEIIRHYIDQIRDRQDF